MQKIPIGILGATGMVGQQFVRLLTNHPWFDITVLAASEASKNKTYAKAAAGRWFWESEIPTTVRDIQIMDAVADQVEIAKKVRLVFSAISLEKEATKALESAYARLGVAVVSNNSAHRSTPDVPMIIPEINADHAALIDAQRKQRGWTTGLIAVKPNCSLQSYVPALQPLREFGLEDVVVSTYQALSGAGKTIDSWPEMQDNVIPFISGEEEKSEQEPMKIWGEIKDGIIRPANLPKISAQCIRVPVSHGHLATVRVRFKQKPTLEMIKTAWKNWQNPVAELNLPSRPTQFLEYFEEDNRPQTRLDRDRDRGMGISIGRLSADPIFDCRFVCLSHNLVRGAAGGAVLMAELLTKKGYIL